MIGTLYISSKKISKNCEEIIGLMHSLGINGHVTKNMTILDGSIEVGCQVIVASQPVRDNLCELWSAAQKKLDLTCSLVEFTHHESGCVFDVFRNSNCPQRN